MINMDTLGKFTLSVADDVTNKKLQKLCYYAYVWYLTVYGESLTADKFEAWAHGPVSPKLYNQYRRYGWDVIENYRGFLPIRCEDADFLEHVISYYDNFTADQLEDMTHGEAPWQLARIGCKPYDSSNNVISDDDIMDYYSKQKDLLCRFQKYA